MIFRHRLRTAINNTSYTPRRVQHPCSFLSPCMHACLDVYTYRTHIICSYSVRAHTLVHACACSCVCVLYETCLQKHTAPVLTCLSVCVCVCVCVCACACARACVHVCVYDIYSGAHGPRADERLCSSRTEDARHRGGKLLRIGKFVHVCMC